MKLYSKKIKIVKYYLAFIVWYIISITLNKTITPYATPAFVISVLYLLQVRNLANLGSAVQV